MGLPLGNTARVGVANKLKLNGVADGARTRHLRFHNPVVCPVSYCNSLEIWGGYYYRCTATNCHP